MYTVDKIKPTKKYTKKYNIYNFICEGVYIVVDYIMPIILNIIIGFIASIMFGLFFDLMNISITVCDIEFINHFLTGFVFLISAFVGFVLLDHIIDVGIDMYSHGETLINNKN